ncbi:hypothetical protein ABQ284_12540 [Lentilactobacillus buchneri]|nr:hypothetical protein [Lentilactobacillus buchneri]
MTWYQDLTIMIWNVITSDWLMILMIGIAIGHEITTHDWKKRSERHG